MAGYHGFLDSGGSLTQIDVPGARTRAFGINDAGQIVGDAFVPFPLPEPPSLALLGIGIGLTGFVMMRRRAIPSKPL